MPKVELRIYQEINGIVPLLEWLDGLAEAVKIKCLAKIGRLAEFGNELRRPDCDFLQDGIYELRIRHGTVQYRILYGFAGKNLVLLSHGCTKEKAVPKREIQAALNRLREFRQNPAAHTYSEELL